MIHENPGKNALYTVFDGSVEELAEQVNSFCNQEYGDRCEFYQVSIERHHPDGGSWTVHEFPSFDDRATRAVENHLKARRDVVKLEFGGSDREYSLDLVICPARNTERLARYVSKQHMEEFKDDDLVVLCVEREADEIAEDQRRMLEELEK